MIVTYWLKEKSSLRSRNERADLVYFKLRRVLLDGTWSSLRPYEGGGFRSGFVLEMQGTIVFESVRVLRHTVTCKVNDRTTLCTRCSCSCRIIFNPQCRGNVSHHYSIRSQRIVTMKTRVEMCRSKG